MLLIFGSALAGPNEAACTTTPLQAAYPTDDTHAGNRTSDPAQEVTTDMAADNSQATDRPTDDRADANSATQSQAEVTSQSQPNITPQADGKKQPAAGYIVPQRRFIHRLGAEFRSEYICPTNSFLKGDNAAQRLIGTAQGMHLRYSFQSSPGTLADRIFKGAYQGVGVAWYRFGSPQELGDPGMAYLFQGARIARLGSRMSLNYEWNFGLSFGWKPYNEQTNNFNKMMGSRLNAFINADIYLAWMLTRHLDLTAGVSLTHFSNGNTEIPNMGLNSVGMRIGMVYNFGRQSADIPPRTVYPAFRRHMNYDLTLFGSWRRRGMQIGDKQYATPESYTVLGFNFAAMYNLSYKFRVGAALDGVYDGSANIFTNNEGGGPDQEYLTPALKEQLALGVSGRAEFVMPYFEVGVGLGINALHGGGDLKSFYQMLTLKIIVTRHAYLHIGYCLKDFQNPNYLMLGVGVRFNNKRPAIR